MKKKITFLAEIVKHEQKKSISNDKGAKVILEYTPTHETIQAIDSLYDSETLIKVTFEEE